MSKVYIIFLISLYISSCTSSNHSNVERKVSSTFKTNLTKVISYDKLVVNSKINLIYNFQNGSKLVQKYFAITSSYWTDYLGLNVKFFNKGTKSQWNDKDYVINVNFIQGACDPFSKQASSPLKKGLIKSFINSSEPNKMDICINENSLSSLDIYTMSQVGYSLGVVEYDQNYSEESSGSPIGQIYAKALTSLSRVYNNKSDIEFNYGDFKKIDKKIRYNLIDQFGIKVFTNGRKSYALLDNYLIRGKRSAHLFHDDCENQRSYLSSDKIPGVGRNFIPHETVGYFDDNPSIIDNLNLSGASFVYDNLSCVHPAPSKNYYPKWNLPPSFPTGLDIITELSFNSLDSVFSSNSDFGEVKYTSISESDFYTKYNKERLSRRKDTQCDIWHIPHEGVFVDIDMRDVRLIGRNKDCKESLKNAKNEFTNYEIGFAFVAPMRYRKKVEAAIKSFSSNEYIKRDLKFILTSFYSYGEDSVFITND